MSDPVLSLLLVVAAAGAIVLAHYFRALDFTLLVDARVPLLTGIVAGAVVVFATETGTPGSFVALGVLLTIGALYVRLTGSESEAPDGMAVGAITGLAAALPLIVAGGGDLRAFTSSVLAGAVAGYGITFGLAHVADRLRQAVVDAITAVVAVAAAWLPNVLARMQISDHAMATAAVALVPLILVATVFQRWPIVRRELSEEASLGVMNHSDVRRTAHPLRRHGRAGWQDRVAHREFVRLATRLALRKRLQQSRPEEIARLYQLEVLKLRMQLQLAERVEMAMRAQAASDDASDTMASRKA